MLPITLDWEARALPSIMPKCTHTIPALSNPRVLHQDSYFSEKQRWFLSVCVLSAVVLGHHS